MAVTASQETRTVGAIPAWQGFRTGLWQKEINVRDFIQQNYEPYEGDDAFLAPATQRSTAIWDRLQAMFVEERRKGVLDVSPIPSSITAHAPGYIDRVNEIIVGLQTDAPLKRAIMPNGGFRLVVNALQAFGYEPEPQVVETFTKYRKTHNDAVFDAYTADVRRCRSSHILTGLPDAYGRGRIIGDYRRVALYGVNRLIARKQEEKNSLDNVPSTDDIIRDREELAEQIRALQELLLICLALLLAQLIGEKAGEQGQGQNRAGDECHQLPFYSHGAPTNRSTKASEPIRTLGWGVRTEALQAPSVGGPV